MEIATFNWKRNKDRAQTVIEERPTGRTLASRLIFPSKWIVSKDPNREIYAPPPSVYFKFASEVGMATARDPNCPEQVETAKASNEVSALKFIQTFGFLDRANDSETSVDSVLALAERFRVVVASTWKVRHEGERVFRKLKRLKELEPGAHLSQQETAQVFNAFKMPKVRYQIGFSKSKSGRQIPTVQLVPDSLLSFMGCCLASDLIDSPGSGVQPLCDNCGEILDPRSNKLFCGQKCRNEFNYKRRSGKL